jgi:hypothetical protein
MSFDFGGMQHMGETDLPPEAPDTGRGRERRATYLALNYWEMLTASGRMPAARSLGADAPAELRPALFMVSMRRPAQTSVIAGAGAALDQLCGAPATGKPLGEALPISLRDTFADLTRVIDTYRKPVLNSGMTQAADGRTVLYRSILMPLSDPAGKVTAYLGAIGCRQLPPLI